MRTQYLLVLSMIAGAALGAAAVQGVNAQLAAKKVYTVTELETLNAQAAADIAPRIAAAQANAVGRNFRTGGGKVIAMEGPPPPHALRSRNGTAWRRRSRSSNPRHGLTSGRIGRRRSRPFVDTPLRWFSEDGDQRLTYAS
jgi:hypothetical protein